MSSDHGPRLRALIASWRTFENGNTRWDDGYESGLLHCADELDALLRASASALPEKEQEPASIKRKDTPENRDYWEFVERVAEQVRRERPEWARIDLGVTLKVRNFLGDHPFLTQPAASALPEHDKWCISRTTPLPCDCEIAPHRVTSSSSALSPEPPDGITEHAVVPTMSAVEFLKNPPPFPKLSPEPTEEEQP